MKNILIIGGAGYVGTELTNYLHEKKYNITCLDTFWFSTSINKKVKKIKLDIRKNICNSFRNFDVIINLACLFTLRWLKPAIITFIRNLCKKIFPIIIVHVCSSYNCPII